MRAARRFPSESTPLSTLHRSIPVWRSRTFKNLGRGLF
jgi:hypothetical protein